MADLSIRLAGVEPAIPTPDNVVVRLRLIGRMEAWTIRSENILPKRRKARAMLAYVAMASRDWFRAGASLSCFGAAGRRSKPVARFVRKFIGCWTL